MPLPFLLGALAALGVGGALGAAHGIGEKKQREDETMRKLIIDSAMQGTSLPDDIIGKYFGNKSAPAFSLLATSAQMRQKQNRDMFMGNTIGSGGGLQPQPQAQPEMAPPDTTPGLGITPEDRSAGAMSIPAPIAPTPSFGGGVQAQPSRTLSGLDLGGGMKGSMTTPPVTLPEAQKLNEHATTQRFLQSVTSKPTSYQDAMREAGRLGVFQNPDVQKAIDAVGKSAYTSAASAWAKQNGAPVTEQDFRAMQLHAYGASGYPDPAYMASLAPTPQAKDELFGSTMRRAMLANQGVSFANLLQGVIAGTGITPSDGLLKQLRDEAGARIEQQLRTDPRFGGNDSMIEAEKQRLLGFSGTTESERGRMNKPANVPADVAAERTRQGVPELKERQLGMQPGAGMPATPVLDEPFAAAERRKITTEQAKTKGELMPAKDLAEQYVTPKGETPELGMTREQLHDAVNKGDVGVLHVDKRTHRNLNTLGGTIATYARVFPVVAPLLDKWGGVEGIFKRVPGKMAAGVTHADIGGFKIPFLPDIPPLTDEQLAKAGITKEQANALTEWTHLNNTALLTLRSIGEGERGNVAQRIIGRGEETFPNLNDNSRTAGKKIDLLIRRLAVEQAGSASFRGKEYAYGVDPKTKEFAIAIMPRGAKLPAGWEFVK